MQLFLHQLADNVLGRSPSLQKAEQDLNTKHASTISDPPPTFVWQLEPAGFGAASQHRLTASTLTFLNHGTRTLVASLPLKSFENAPKRHRFQAFVLGEGAENPAWARKPLYTTFPKASEKGRLLPLLLHIGTRPMNAYLGQQAASQESLCFKLECQVSSTCRSSHTSHTSASAASIAAMRTFCQTIALPVARA